MANTPLQNGLGHIYGPGRVVKSEGIIPVWLEQNGSRVMGGIIDLSYKVDGTNKVSDFWPSSIRTGTPCVELGSHQYAPIPTYRVLEDVSSTDTSVKIAKQEGLPVLVAGMSLANAEDSESEVSVTASAISLDEEDGYYILTITAGDLGTLAAGDVLVPTALADKTPVGLTKSNLLYKGLDDLDNTKLNITLVDEGRLIADTAPAASKAIRASLQTVKWENIY